MTAWRARWTKGARRAAIVILVALAAVVAPSPASAADLFGEVGPEFTISMRDANGEPVLRLEPGEYTITIRDLSDIHNFHLTGPGIDLSTAIERVETVVWTVTLVPGRYAFVCDPHLLRMRGAFVVAAAQPEPQPEPEPQPPVTPTLMATVDAKGIPSLRRSNGRVRVTTLTAGTYIIVVRDRSSKHSFWLSGHGLNRRTGSRFRGTVRWRVTLHPGVYRYSSGSGRPRRSFRVR